MLSIEVAFDDDGARASLQRLRNRLGAIDELHDAMGERVSAEVSRHILKTKGPKSPNTDYWAKAAKSVVHESSATGAVVSVTQIGVALRYYGGTVRQKPGGPLLTLPSKYVPVQNKTRLAARMAGPLAFIPSKKDKTAGVLVEGELTGKTIRKGKRAGEPATRPKPGGRLMYVLRTQTDHRPDPTILPTDQQLAEVARDAALDYVGPDLT